MVQTSLLLSPEQAAQELGIGRTQLFRLLAEGAVVSVKIGRSRRIPRDSLHAYVNGLVAGSAA